MLTQSIRSKIFNYQAFVKDLDITSFVENLYIVPCTYSNFNTKDIDKNHQHILTGDLGITFNVELKKKLASKGPKYREPVNVSWQEAKTLIFFSLNEYIK